MNLGECTQNLQFLVFHHHTCQTNSSKDKALSNKVGRMAFPVEVILPLLLAASVFVQWTYEQRSHGGRTGHYE